MERGDPVRNADPACRYARRPVNTLAPSAPVSRLDLIAWTAMAAGLLLILRFDLLPALLGELVERSIMILIISLGLVMLWTGWNFMMDSVSVWEVSFTEWAIQYWPVKSTMAIGAFLILLQGFAKLTKDVLILAGKEA